MARVMPRPIRINGCRLLTHSLKKRKDETVRRLVSFRLIPNHGGGEMEDLSPPDHNDPTSKERVSRQSRSPVFHRLSPSRVREIQNR